MKGKICCVLNVILLLAAILAFALRFQPVTAAPRMWWVNDDGWANFKTIQEAVDAASAGDTVYVCNGTYNEAVLVNKSLLIVGESKDSTIVRSSGVMSDVFNVTATDVFIANLTIGDGVCGINVLGSRVTISMCKFSFNSIGAYLQGMNCSVLDSEFALNDVGIDICRSSSNFIMHNRFVQNNWIGLSLEFDSGSNIVKFNDVSMNGYSPYFPDILGGIFLFNSENNTLAGNNIVSNKIQVNDRSNKLSSNVWSEEFPAGGNYWSDYVTKYPNASEIEDSVVWATPYVINTLNVDTFPLMNPVKAFDALGPDGKSYDVTASSNSTISGFSFNPDDGPSISFVVAGPSGTTGSCGIIIPKELLASESGWYVIIDGETVNHATIPTESFTYLHFAYNHSIRAVMIKPEKAVPEFNVLVALLLLMTATALITAVLKRKKAESA